MKRYYTLAELWKLWYEQELAKIQGAKPESDKGE